MPNVLSETRVGLGWCCLMTPGLSKDIGIMYDHTFFKPCKSSDRTSGHTYSGLSAWWLNMVTLIFVRGLCGHVWVNIHTLSPPRVSTTLSLSLSLSLFLSHVSLFPPFLCILLIWCTSWTIHSGLQIAQSTHLVPLIDQVLSLEFNLLSNTP